MRAQRILIADDDPKLLALVKLTLQKEGFATIEALDGEVALAQIKSEKPDLIIADITMPKIDGFELCTLVREDPELANTPFIFLTAKGELSDRVKGLNLGADDYISKPFHISEVVARIKVVLQRSAAFARVADDTESDLRGNLEQMGMAEIVQTLGMSHKTGGLKIIHQSRVGKIYFKHGDIIKASLEKYTDEEAVYRILTWNEGYFEFDSNDMPAKTINMPTTSLLMEGFRQRDEFFKYTKAMPAFTSRLRLTNPSNTSELKPASQKIANLIDGHRTIREIINLSPLNYLVTVKLIFALLKKSIVEAIVPQQNQDIEEEDYSQLAHELYK
jgi:CheY-like chemotaxis protein